MNKFQKVASKLAKNAVKEESTNVDFKIYKNEWLRKFKNQCWEYPNILKYKNDYILWSNEINRKL